ncbi:MAG: UDP-3-O-(3-hydroxymyristoyl)glucosamine N-acyltransferase [Syntrophobacterales bacterium]|jgi:UDP-3-O-[3-hydroxymyristoyl] glucosamine N-acyltransferase|nr:UDP-3-O-(3-hydroxymyristoyl)glucosamine N-acyltransferase [Syntrophobacterales bacterium]
MIGLKEIAAQVGGHLLGEDVLLSGISTIGEAKEGEIAVLTNPAYRKLLTGCRASAIVIGEGTDVEGLKGRNLVVVKNPSFAYLTIAELFDSPREHIKKIHPLAVVSDGAAISDGVSIYPYACIEKGTVIERNVTIYPFVYIGANVRIGEGSTIHPHVTVYDGTVIGKRVTVHGGAVLGADGFGYMWDGKSHAKIPQLGALEIGDDVEIGANTTIDRASLGKTLIGKGVRIDNLVQIAHNVSVGENSIIVSQVGIAGSAVIGRNVVLAGQAGVRDHVTVGDNVKAGGGTGITSNVSENSLILGTPHMPHREWAKLQGYLKRLPKLFAAMKRIEKKLHLEVENGRD